MTGHCGFIVNSFMLPRGKAQPNDRASLLFQLRYVYYLRQRRLRRCPPLSFILGGSSTDHWSSTRSRRCHGVIVQEHHHLRTSHLKAAFIDAARRWLKELLWRQSSSSSSVLLHAALLKKQQELLARVEQAPLELPPPLLQPNACDFPTS